MLVSLLLLGQLSKPIFLPIDLPKIRRIRPGPEAGSYVVDTVRDWVETFHYWPVRADRPSLTAQKLEDGYQDLRVKSWSLVDIGYDTVFWTDKGETRITAQNRANILLQGNRKIRPPKGQNFMLLSPDARFVVTATRKDEADLELWKVESGAIRFVRNLGRMWYDGGSTGVPSNLAVSGDGLVVFDCPRGGGGFEVPVLVGLDGIQRSLESLALDGNVTFVAPPTAFEKGALLPVNVLEMQRTVENDEPYTETRWLVWYSKEGAFGKLLPTGFLNIVKTGPMSAQVAVRVKGGVELRSLSLPPTGWHKIDISKCANFGRPW